VRALGLAVAALALASPAAAQTVTCFNLGSGGGLTMLTCDGPTAPQTILVLPVTPSQRPLSDALRLQLEKPLPPLPSYGAPRD
jgi:hypothetical protein